MKHNTVLPIEPGLALKHGWMDSLPPDVLDEMNTKLAENYRGPTIDLPTLMDDEACAGSAVLVMLDALMSHLAGLEDTLSQVPELYHAFIGDEDEDRDARTVALSKRVKIFDWC